MNSRQTQVVVNDYLDLYLYAGRIGDTSWQHEILETLQNLRNEIKQDTLSLDHLWKQFKYINEEILTLYQQLRNHSTGSLEEKLWELKQQRISLGHQIRLAYNQSKQVS